MPKHRRIWNADIHRKYIKEGRGSGSGSDYKPWIRIQDFASRGVVSRVKGNTTGRVHHLMSKVELAYFYILDWSESVTDICEQYPLSDLELAVKIAAKAGIKYPKDNVSGYPYILTCDFMVVTATGQKARTIKMASELGNARTLEKLEIERRYWLEYGVDWGIVTEREIPFEKAKNIEWIYSARGHGLIGGSLIKQEQAQEMMLCLLSMRHSIIEAAKMVECHFRLDRGMGIQLFKHLALNELVTVNLDSPLDLNARGATA